MFTGFINNKLWLTFVLAFLTACSTVAQHFEEQVPPLVEPQSAVLEDDYARLSYSHCLNGHCVDRVEEIQRFDMELDDGTTISCLAVYLEMTWPDHSKNIWIWPAKESDPRCQAEMERIAR